MAGDMDRRKGWYLDRGLNPAYIIPLLGSILAGLAWAGSVNSTQQVQDTRIGTVEEKTKQIEKNNREDYQKINEKLDRILERQK